MSLGGIYHEMSPGASGPVCLILILIGHIQRDCSRISSLDVDAANRNRRSQLAGRLSHRVYLGMGALDHWIRDRSTDQPEALSLLLILVDSHSCQGQRDNNYD